MNTDNINNLNNLFFKILEEDKKRNAEREKRKHFQDIGRRGGLKKKNENLLLSEMVSTRLTKAEFSELNSKAKSQNLTVAKYVRMVLTEKELKVNQYDEEIQLLQIATELKSLRKQTSSNLSEKIDITLILLNDYLTQKLKSNE